MAKVLTVAQKTALADKHIAYALLFEVDFPTGIQYYTTAQANIVYGGNTYLGGVNPAWIDQIRETEQNEATGLRVALSGVSQSQRAIALGEHIQGRRFTMRLAPMSVASGYAIVDTPIVEFDGLMDTITIEDDDNGTMTLTLEVESKMARLTRPNARRYTDRDHQQRNPGDEACKFTSQVERTIVWPAANFFRR